MKCMHCAFIPIFIYISNMSAGPPPTAILLTVQVQYGVANKERLSLREEKEMFEKKMKDADAAARFASGVMEKAVAHSEELEALLTSLRLKTQQVELELRSATDLNKDLNEKVAVLGKEKQALVRAKEDLLLQVEGHGSAQQAWEKSKTHARLIEEELRAQVDGLHASLQATGKAKQELTTKALDREHLEAERTSLLLDKEALQRQMEETFARLTTRSAEKDMLEQELEQERTRTQTLMFEKGVAEGQMKEV